MHACLVAEQPPSGAAGENAGHGRPAAGVLVPHPADVPLQITGPDHAENRTLGRAPCPLPQPRRHLHEPGHQFRLGHEPADPQRRREDLGGRAQVHHDAGVQPEQGRQRADVIPELAVVVVFDDQRPGRARPGDQRPSARNRKPAAERVLVGGGDVDHPQPGDTLGEVARLSDQAVGIHRAGDQACPVGGEHRPRGRVPGLLHSDLVTWPQQRGRDQPEAAGHAAGDHDLLGPAADSPAAPQVTGECRTERGAALRLRGGNGRLGAGAAPGPPPRRAVDAGHPGDARPQLDQPVSRARRLPRPWPAGPGAGRPPIPPVSRARPARAIGDIGARAMPALGPPLREQLGVRTGHDRPADPEGGRERAGRRQPLARRQPAIGHRGPQLAHDLDGERRRGRPFRGERQVHAGAPQYSQSGLPFSS